VNKQDEEETRMEKNEENVNCIQGPKTKIEKVLKT